VVYVDIITLHVCAETARMEPGVLGYCFAQYDYSARNPNEISMKQGDKIAVVSKDGDRRGWWKGRNYDKVIFPPRLNRVCEL